MYSNCRLLSTRARSTLTETGTGPSPLDDGGETHTISFMDRLQADRRRVRSRGKGAASGPRRHFPQLKDGFFCPVLLQARERPLAVCISVSFYLSSNSGWVGEAANWRRGLEKVGQGHGSLGFGRMPVFLDFSKT